MNSMDKLLDAVKELAGVSKPIEKLLKIVANGMGKAYEPLNIIFLASAESKADRIKRVGEIKTKWKVKEEHIKGLGRVGEKILFQEKIKLENIDTVVANAMQLLTGSDIISDEMPSQDWINNFFSTIENVSDKEAQLLWSKVLSEEVKTPGSLGIRGIEILRGISKDEAIAFERAAKYIVFNPISNSNGYIILGWGAKQLEPISYNDLLQLEKAGLVINSNRSTMSFQFDDKDHSIGFGHGKDNILMFEAPDDEDLRLVFINYSVTETAVELARILAPDLDLEYLKELNISMGNNRFKMKYGKIQQITNGMIDETQMTSVGH